MNPLHELIGHGQSYWIDNLTRSMIRSGELKRRVEEEGLRGVTSNPKIFSNAISQGEHYDEQIGELVRAGTSVGAIYEAIAVRDIQDACDVLRGVYEESEGGDGFVSLEVSPYLAHDTGATVDEARRLFQAVDRPNVLIKIPGTPAGVPAIEQMLYEGVNINITLLFSIRAYEEVAEAYLRASERRVDDGLPIDRIASVASFFLSRIDVLTDELLSHRIRPGVTTDETVRPERLLGQAGIASAKLAYQSFKRIFAGSRWNRLVERGGRAQRVLWASTSTKNPLYSDVKYVEPLIGPHTVNTMPGRTIRAFADHGCVSETIEADLDDAERLMHDLKEVGVDLDQVTDQLVEEGIQKFVAPFDDLLATLAEARHESLGVHAVGQRIEAAGVPADVDAAMDGLDEAQFGRRLLAKDPSLWKSDPEHAEVIRNRLGWLQAPEDFTERREEILDFAREVRDDGFDHVVHMGMGGSSLCPEVCRRIFGSAEGWPELIVLDDTDPAAVREVERRIDLARTLFIVASKSGTTTETMSFYRYFYDRIAAAGVDEPGSRFTAITDPDTPLADEAEQREFRRVFENPVDIGGRYSALSYFGLVPMALIGIDLENILNAARQMRVSCGAEVPSSSNLGVELGTALGLWAGDGRDKVTFSFSRSVAPFGLWLEQLLAESTGKEGRGLVPIAGEPLGEPAVYGEDRVFVCMSAADDGQGDDLNRRLAALEKAGHPVIRIELADRIGLGAEFFHWEVATATAGAIIGVDAFDEPNVAESKRNTRQLLERWQEDGAFPADEAVVEGLGVTVFAAPNAVRTNGSHTESVDEFLSGFAERIHAGDYFALLPYFRATDGRREILDSMRRQLRDRLQVATTLGYGPRYLHSTGQLHKGGPENGVYMLITANAEADLAIPDESYGFATLHEAQALGDFRSLVDRARRVVRVHLGDDVEAGLGILASALE